MLVNEPVLNFETLFHHADAGDAVALDVVQHCTELWSALTVALIHAYGPELVIFGGGVMRRGSSLLRPIQSYVEKHMWRTSSGVPRIECAALGPDAALLGGSALYHHVASGPQDVTIHV